MPSPTAGRAAWRRGVVTPPYGCNAGGAKRRADVGIGPYERRKGSVNHSGQRRRAGRLRRGREGWVGIATEIIPKGGSNLGQSLSRPPGDSSLYTREPWGRGMRIAASALRASSQWQWFSVIPRPVCTLAVGIRPFYDGRGFGPPHERRGERHAESSCPTESPINHPSQPARNEASAPAAARDGRESTQGPSQKGDRPATSRAALSEAESAERGAGQIRFLPDDLRVQHGVQRSEVSAKPRPCSRRSYVN